MRPDRDTWAMAMAVVTAQRRTCLRRAVGCVLLNAKGHVLSTGYNGVAAGQPHCNEVVHLVTLKYNTMTPPDVLRADPDFGRTCTPYACSGAF